MEQNCLQCGEKLTGRTDKKFCDDYCRNSFNNRRTRIKNPSISLVNYYLKRNRTILEVLFKTHPNSFIPLRLLSDHGFNFCFFTHEENLRTCVRKYCYDYGYERVNETNVNLVRWEPKD